MAAYTAVPLGDAERLVRDYSLVGVTEVAPVPAGTVNSNYLVSVAGQVFFLRVYEEAGPEGARYEARLAAHLASRGVPTPVPLRTRSGDFATTHAGKPAALFPVVGGEELCQARVTPERARRVGSLVAQIQRAASDFPDRRTSRFGIDDLRRRLRGVVREDLRGAVARIRSELDRVEATRDPALPTGTTHGDLFRDNVRWDGEEIVAALDFESAAMGTLAYDLAVTILAWCFTDRFEPSLVSALVAGYESVRRLEPSERAGLVAEAELACLRFATTRITDVETRSTGGGPRKDYRRFLARLDEVGAALGVL